MDQNNPTNADIYQKLGKIEEITLETREQAKRTNGRVSRLEKWQNEITAVEKYKLDNLHNPEGNRDNTKILLTALGLVATALTIIGALVAGR